MPLSRFDARKSAVLEKTNAIGNAALPDRVLSEPCCSRIAPLFQDWAALRLAKDGLAIHSPTIIANIQRPLLIASMK